MDQWTECKLTPTRPKQHPMQRCSTNWETLTPSCAPAPAPATLACSSGWLPRVLCCAVLCLHAVLCHALTLTCSSGCLPSALRCALCLRSAVLAFAYHSEGAAMQAACLLPSWSQSKPLLTRQLLMLTLPHCPPFLPLLPMQVRACAAGGAQQPGGWARQVCTLRGLGRSERVDWHAEWSSGSSGLHCTVRTACLPQFECVQLAGSPLPSHSPPLHLAHRPNLQWPRAISDAQRRAASNAAMLHGWMLGMAPAAAAATSTHR